MSGRRGFPVAGGIEERKPQGEGGERGVPRIGRRLRPLLVTGGLVVGVLLAPAIAGLLLAPRPTAGRPVPEAPAPDEAGAARFLEGLDRSREGQWARAREAFAAAAAAGIPEAPAHRAAAERRLALEAAAAGIRERLASAEVAAAAREFRGAELDQADRAALEGEVREAVRGRRAELAKLLGGGDGGDRAVALEEWRLLAAAFPEEVGEAPAPPSPRARKAGGSPAAERALAAFRAGEVGRARAALAGCESERCRSLDRELAAVEAALGSGAGGAAAADGEAVLEAAVAAAERLGGSAPVARRLGESLAPRYHAAGVAALGRGDLATARERFDRALRLRPDHGPSREGRERLRERAREAFLAGYAEKDAAPDRARQKFLLVTTITGPDEELHRKARHWLARLEAGTAAP